MSDCLNGIRVSRSWAGVGPELGGLGWAVLRGVLSNLATPAHEEAVDPHVHVDVHMWNVLLL